MAALSRVERPHPARWLLAVVLVVIGCVLTPVALAGTWARRQVLEVDRFVETTSPLARDPAVVAALIVPFLDRVRILFVVGLVVTTVGVLLSPWRAARAGEQRERGSALSWLRGHRGDVAWTVLAAGLGVLVWWPEPTFRVTASVVGLAVVAGLVAALVGRGARPAPAT